MYTYKLDMEMESRPPQKMPWFWLKKCLICSNNGPKFDFFTKEKSKCLKIRLNAVVSFQFLLNLCVMWSWVTTYCRKNEWGYVHPDVRVGLETIELNLLLQHDWLNVPVFQWSEHRLTDIAHPFSGFQRCIEGAEHCWLWDYMCGNTGNRTTTNKLKTDATYNFHILTWS